ncbi:MAG: 16S rRNA (cytosine(967)-C(5))-methyltransferase RsmB [Desulfofustis sp.]|nr:16S rRNA (cytosine(967)-C(5))-methyltransferase RsmB [Desulfofustis sp.]
MKMTPRSAAITILCELDKARVPVSAIFDRMEQGAALERQDRQLAMKIVYGVLRNRDYLDRLLAHLCRQPLGKMKPYVHQALRCGLFQIFFLDRIPPSAAVNETVKAVKAKKLPSRLQGFVNGVLRESIRQKAQLPNPEEPDESGRPLLNHPAWLTNRWQQHYGEEEMRRICQHNNHEPLLCLRVDSIDLLTELRESFQVQSIAAISGNYAPKALLVRDYRGKIDEIKGIDQGTVQVQDQASQLASMLLAPFSPGLSCLDGCAGVGGKTTHLRLLLEEKNCRLTAVEPDIRRYQLLKQNLQRQNKGCPVGLHHQTLQKFAESGGAAFDRIIIDAPCSGTGVIGRHPDIRWNRREQDLEDFVVRQLELLNLAATLLAEDGILVYATCSIEPEENSGLVERFLTEHSEFTLTDCASFLPPSCNELIREGYLAPLPDTTIDGFFCARLCRKR